MKRSRFILGMVILPTVVFASSPSFAEVASFSGGSCASQGDWVQGAISQADAIVAAINTLRDDPNCTALVKTLDNSEQLKALSQGRDGGDAGGMSGFYQELQSIGTYLKPRVTMKAGEPMTPDSYGQKQKSFRDIVNYMVFRKSLETVNDLKKNKEYDSLNPSQRESVDWTSSRLQSFLERSGRVANVAVATTQSILSAMPDNEMCFNNRPNEAGIVFGSLISAAASLASGGQISNVGQVVSSLVQFERKMTYTKLLKGVELEKYRASMSCLVETTQEAYCSLRDAQDALDFNRGATNNSVLKSPLENPKSDIENSMQGLMVLLRDVPIITSWMQRILFGIDPKLTVEADMKNANWDSFNAYMKALNTLPGVFMDRRKKYFDSTTGADIQTKISGVRALIEEMTREIRNAGTNNSNFFTDAVNEDNLPFYLIGVEPPDDFNTQTNRADNIMMKWGQRGTYGFGNPDTLVDKIGTQLNRLVDKASALSSSYFSERMIVDSQNLIVEGMNSPNISPYKGLFHVRAYAKHLVAKLEAGLKDPKISQNPGNADAYRAMIPLLQDTIMRLNKLTDAMAKLSEFKVSDSPAENIRAARVTMDIIYTFANMLTSRDSFIANRMANFVRMDVTDTLWRHDNVSPEQDQLMKSMGRDIMARLSQFFTQDPILQRLDVAQAAPIHDANLAAIEGLFANNYWEQLVELNCKLFGGSFCGMTSIPSPKSEGFLNTLGDQLWANFSLRAGRDLWRMATSYPTEDSAALFNQRARLCAQTLGFPTYSKRFASLCKDATIVSEFSDEQDSLGLNFSYGTALKEMTDIQAAAKPGSITDARAAGVCAFRSYIRRNNVYRMYKELQQ